MPDADPPPVPILDLHPPAQDDEAEVLAGLSRSRQRTLPAKLFYDARGSRLFEQICDLPEYYPTRVEVLILTEARADLARLLGPGVTIVEFGSGSTRKVRLLLEALDAAAYVPVDISRWYLEAAARELAADLPELVVRPVLADYGQNVPLPGDLPPGPRVGFFPGGTFGNFTFAGGVGFLRRAARTLGQGGHLLIGYDVRKDPALLHAAYNDAAGVTALFNLNVLRRINDTLAGTFDLAAWRHYAPYLPTRGRIEMHLVAADDQRVRVAGHDFTFERGDSIRTELSHKFTPGRFAAIAHAGGFGVVRSWTDADALFRVDLLRVGA